MGFNCYTPAETAELVSRAGVAKANMRIDKIFMSGVMAGMMLSFACASVLSTNTAPWFQENAPGLIRTIAALIFPYGLCMIILTGSDLCTGSFLVCETLRIIPNCSSLLVLRNTVYYCCLTSSPSFHSQDAHALVSHLSR